jgi:hypothetical protein
VEISDGAVIKCNYELYAKVASKSNMESKTPSNVTIHYLSVIDIGVLCVFFEGNDVWGFS